jgi:hypothetical protein
MRGRWADQALQELYLKRLVEALAGNTPVDLDTLVKGMLDGPDLLQLQYWIETTLECPDRTITVDIETAGPYLMCVGMCRVWDLNPVVVRFRARGGAQFWPSIGSLTDAITLVWGVLASPDIPKWFHNGQAFDVPYLTRLGFVVEGYVGDTLLAQRYLYPQLAADLQSVANIYAGIPAWKWMASNTDEEGVK